jgi:peptidoglycan hydrolase-like protein with peptidoglycan-binding domain
VILGKRYRSCARALRIQALPLLAASGLLCAAVTPATAAADPPLPNRSFEGCPALVGNSTGSCVRMLQYELDSVGPYNLLVDGTFGQDTFTAVLDFQGRNHLGADGIVGPVTADLLDAQAGPAVVCSARGGSLSHNGTCDPDAAIPMGKSVWECIQDEAGKDVSDAIEKDAETGAKKAGEEIPKTAIKELLKKYGAPAEAFKCITFG